MSNYDRALSSCAASRELITQLLEALEELERMEQLAPRGAATASMKAKVAKLRTASETQILKAIDALADCSR